MAILCLVYAPIHIYRLNYFITSVILVVTLHQIFAPEQPAEESESSVGAAEEQDPIERYEQIKQKME